MNQAKVQAVDYLQFLLATSVRYTCTEAARVQPEQPAPPAHDLSFNRLLTDLQPDPEDLWLEARPQIRLDDGVLILDDSTLDKPYARKIELVGWHWSGKHHRRVKGINLLTLLWTDGDRHVPCDYDIYDKAHDGNSKNDLFAQQLRTAKARGMNPKCVCFDSWFSSLENLKLIRTKSIPAAEIERVVVEQVRRVGRDPALVTETLAQARRQDQERLAELEAERRALERDLARWNTELKALSGQPERLDYEYERKGTANLFLAVEPLAGWRAVLVTERRPAVDFAEVVRGLVEDVYTDADKVVLVMDNLNRHKAASLDEAFPPEQARNILERLEVHHTLRHGSWLNRAEIEQSALSRQCLDRRIDDAEKLREEIVAWEDERNERAVGINWYFTTADPRRKLRKLYPTTQAG